MTTARRVTALGLVLLALGLVGCGSDDKGADLPTAADIDTETTTQLAVPDPAAFVSTIERLTTELEAAEGDLCALFGKLEGAAAAGEPTTEEQVQVAFRFLGAVYEKIADAAPPELEKAAKQIRKSAKQMTAEADEPIDDVAAANRLGPTPYEDKAFLDAMSNFSTIVADCATDQANQPGG